MCGKSECWDAESEHALGECKRLMQAKHLTIPSQFPQRIAIYAIMVLRCNSWQDGDPEKWEELNEMTIGSKKPNKNWMVAMPLLESWFPDSKFLWRHNFDICNTFDRSLRLSQVTPGLRVCKYSLFFLRVAH